jgi:hypothetical protein
MFASIQPQSQVANPLIAVIISLVLLIYLVLVYGFKFRLVNHRFEEEKLIFSYFFFIKSVRYEDIEILTTPSFAQFFIGALDFTKTKFTAVEMPFLKIVCLKSRSGGRYYFTPPHPDRFMAEVKIRCSVYGSLTLSNT